MIGHMRHGSPPRLMALQSILSPNRRESLPTPSAGGRITSTEKSVHGTRLFYELLSCGDPCRRMDRGGWPAMRSRHQEMASLCAASRIFLSSQPAPMARHYG